MITIEEALNIVQEYTFPVGKVTVKPQEALGSVLAEGVVSLYDLPYFDNSAVDGFAVKLADVERASKDSPVELALIETIAAGQVGTVAPDAGQAVKILTGAPVPDGTEAVIMQEFTEPAMDSRIRLFRAAAPGENIRRRGEEMHRGDRVLGAGVVINPATVGLLAALGCDAIMVFRKPKVGILVTGSELVPPGQPLQPGQIYESNSHSLKAALTALGIKDVLCRTVGDNPEEITGMLKSLLDETDMVITTGGVSVGEFDWVKPVMTDIGIQAHFWGVAIKPGKPVFFGTYCAGELEPEKPVFGLPGNPVAVLLTFYLLVKPALLKMMGLHDIPLLKFKARLMQDIRKKPGRTEYVRGLLIPDADGMWTAQPVLGQGSHMLSGLAKANGLIIFPLEADYLEAGTIVDVHVLNWQGGNG